MLRYKILLSCNTFSVCFVILLSQAPRRLTVLIKHYTIIKLMRALIGQSSIVYCASKPMEISRVF